VSKLFFGGLLSLEARFYWIRTNDMIQIIKIWADPVYMKRVWREFRKRKPRDGLKEFLSFLEMKGIKHELVQKYEEEVSG